MGALDFMKDRPTLADRQRERYAPAKGSTVVRQIKTRAAKKDRWEQCQDAVWDRDKGISRASGKPLVRASTDARKRGEVAHLDARSTNPEKKFDLKNLVLLSAEEHGLSDARTAPGGKVLLEIKGKNASKILTFIRRDINGREVWRHTS